MAGLEDKAENYKKVTYEITADGDETLVTLTQNNNSSQEEKITHKRIGIWFFKASKNSWKKTNL